MNYISRSLGKCVTEYKHLNFDELAQDATFFFVCSQDRNLDHWTLNQFLEAGIKEVANENQCGYGQRLYASRPETNQMIKLIEIIDSSD